MNNRSIRWGFRQYSGNIAFEPLYSAGWLLLAGMATLLLAAINPYGWEQTFLPLLFATNNKVLLAVTEFIPTLKTEYAWVFIPLAIGAFLAIVLRRQRRVVDFFLFAIFGYLAFRHMRNVAMFALVMYVPMARGLASLLKNITTFLQRDEKLVRPGTVKMVFWGINLLCLLYVLVSHVLDPKWGGVPLKNNFPVIAVHTINQIEPRGHIFNFLEMGGYLSWALEGRYQVFIDGRNFKNNKSLAAFLSIVRGRIGWQKAFENYDINTIVIPALYLPYGHLIPIVSILADDPEWQLAATGSREMLFFRDSVARGLPLKYQLDKSLVWQQVVKEAWSINSQLPRVPEPFLSMGEAYSRLGQDRLAIEAFQTYLRLKPDDQTVAERLAALEAKQ